MRQEEFGLGHTALRIHRGCQLCQQQSAVVVTGLRAAPRHHGRITVAGDYPARIRLNWQWRTSPSLELVGQLEARGDLRRYDVDHTLQLPQELATEGWISYVDDVLQFDLSNSWAALEWPVGDSLLTSTGGTLKLAGSPNSVKLALDTRASFDDLPETQIRLEGVLDPDKIRMTQLDAESDLGRLAASGDVRWQPALSFDVAYAVEDLDPSLAYEPLTGQVSAGGIATGEWVAGDPRVTVVVGGLDGSINKQPLDGGGTFAYSEEQITVSRGRVQLGANRLGFSGAVGDRLSLDAQVEFPVIRELFPDARPNVAFPSAGGRRGGCGLPFHGL